MSLLQNGTAAPGFSLPSAPDQTLSLSDLRGKNGVLVFYPADWSPVCSGQLAIYNEVLGLFEKNNARLVGISVDSRWCHQAWKRDRNLDFPLLADFEPKGEVARRYGVYRSRDGTSERAIYLIDGQGRIRWSFLSDIDVDPGADGILEALESLQSQEAHA